MCGNFLATHFYVKSILANGRVSKTGILTILEALTKCRNWLKPYFSGAETVKVANFETPDSQKLISRKILVAGKFYKFHTVGQKRNFERI